MTIRAAQLDLSNPGPLPKLAWLSLDLLVIDPRYQRTTDSTRSKQVIKLIADTFHWSKCQPLIVCRIEDGKYAVIDGQHRLGGAKLRGDIAALPCLIVEAVEIKSQARSFMAINRDRVSVNYIHMHHAAVAAGEPDAVHIQQILDQSNVKLPTGPRGTKDLKPGYTVALGAVGGGLKQFGDGPVLKTLSILTAAYSDRCGALRATVINGMVQFFAANKGKAVDMSRLQRTLADLDPDDLEKNASIYRKTMGGSSAAAIRAAVTKAYNKGLAADNRLPEGA